MIVADSSSDENKKLNKEIISSVSNLDIKYLDNYPTTISPHHKMADAVNNAEEKYCVLCADDDFVTPTGIEESVDFLEKNSDFALAHGQYVAFRLEAGWGKPRFSWAPIYARESITFLEPEKRLSYHLSNYSQGTTYAVHRTNILKMAYSELLKSKVDPVLFGELLPSMLTVIHGKLKHMEVFYAARDSISSSNPYGPSPRDFITAGKYEENYAKFRQCLAAHLSEQSQLDIDASNKVVDEAMTAYMKPYFAEEVAAHKPMRGVVLDYLHLPGWMDKTIRNVYLELFVKPISLIREFQVTPRNITDKPSTDDLPQCGDLGRIRLYILAHLKSVYGRSG